MADWDFDEFDGYDRRDPVDGGGRGARFQTLVNGAGAMTSAALIVGLGVWAYNLAVRDVRGIPVIEALEGPARAAPENPGGELALHQGLAVNEIAADGTAGDPADRLTLAPRAESLDDSDQAMGELAGWSAAPATSVPGAVIPAPDFTGAPLAEPLPDGPADPIADPLSAPAASIAVDVISADIPGVSRSPRPVPRPAQAVEVDLMAEAAAAAVAAALAPSLPVDVAVSALGEGAQLAHIGSYADQATARLEWDKTAARFGALMDGKRRVIEPADSGGETFYRLRVEGFDDLEDARRFCAALKAENSECVPAVVR
ncbi:MAG: SPOR domain-containing protein [Albidovulum sp.]|uniref:SPOR domain-containing protein n=1 Tax=Albidovulum sp. TaxID=1872424 RepID=UPI003CBF9C2C